eukprot:4640795-Alexandrium_andersonii.AAC.1
MAQGPHVGEPSRPPSPNTFWARYPNFYSPRLDFGGHPSSPRARSSSSGGGVQGNRISRRRLRCSEAG